MFSPTDAAVNACRVCVNLGSVNALSAKAPETILINERTEKTDSVFARMLFAVQVAATLAVYSVDAKRRLLYSATSL